MSDAASDSTEKSFDPTPEKLRQAREKGEVARSADLSTAAGYAGLFLALVAIGADAVASFGSQLQVLIDQPDILSAGMFQGIAEARLRETVWQAFLGASPLFVAPAAAVVVSILAQQAFVFTPSKLAPKLSRISLLSNAKQKLGRNGLFEFAKSFAKLLLFSTALAIFLRQNLGEMLALAQTDAAISTSMMGRYCVRFLALTVLLSMMIGLVDTVWQYFELRRKNRMSRQDILDETKASEGDPHLKQSRRQRGQEIALNQMMTKVPESDVVIVNPTHYAVALKWSRLPGSAPTCTAKGADDVAKRIREAAMSAGVPVHSNPPTARALFATVKIGDEISEDLYPAVAAAIRFADEMRFRSKGRAF